MLPTINKSFLIKFVIVALVLSGALVGVHALQARRIPDALLAQSERANTAGKTNTAIHYLRQYLEFRPDDVEALERLSTMLRERPNGNGADLLILYDKILQRDPNRESIRREALKLALAWSRYNDAETHGRELLKSYPNDVELHREMAVAMAGLQRADETAKYLESAIQLAPNDTKSYKMLANYCLGDWKRPKDAIDVLNRMVSANEHDADVYTTRARYAVIMADDPLTPTESRQPLEKQAISDLRTALELDPEQMEATLLLADQMQKGRDLFAAHDLLANGMKLYPKEPRFVRQLAWLELNRGNLGSAVTVLEEAMTRVEDSFELLVPLADLLVQMGETDRSKEILTKIESRKDRQSRMQAKYIKARLSMREGHWHEAIDLLLSLRTDAIDLPGLECRSNLLLSVCYNRRADSLKELECLKLLLNRDPNHREGRVAYGNALYNAGQYDEAIAEMGRASQSTYASSGTRATFLRMRAAKLRMSNVFDGPDWDELDRLASDLKFGPASSEGTQLRAELLAVRGQRGKALSLLRSEVIRRPGDARLWGVLAYSACELGGVAAGLAILDEAQAICGDGAEVRLARAAIYSRDPARIRPIEQLGQQIDTWPDAEQSRLLSGLVEIYDAIGDSKGLISTYRRLAGRNPTDTALWEALYDRACRAGDLENCKATRSTLGKLPKSASKSLTLLNALDAINRRDIGSVDSCMNQLKNEFGENIERPDACLAMARLHLLKGQRTEAEVMYARAIQLEPTHYGPVQEWLEFLTNTGDTERLKTAIRRLAADYRWYGEPFQRAIHQSVRRSEPARARLLLDTARVWIEPLPGGPGQLAEDYAAIGQLTESRKYLDYCINRPTATTDDWLRYALHAGVDGPKVIEQAKTRLKLPGYLTVCATYAETPAAPKGWKPTLVGIERRYYAQASLAIKLSRYDRTSSILMLEEFAKLPELSAAELGWAHRNTAMLLAARNEPGDHKKARELLTAKSNAVGESIDERRATAAVLSGIARNMQAEDRKTVLNQAITIMTGIFKETQDRKDQFLLVQLYRSLGDRANARKELVLLLQADSRNLDYLVAGLDESTEKDDRDFAESCSQRLLALFPTDHRAVSAVARYEFRTGKPEKALTVMNAYSRTVENLPGDLQIRNVRTAEVLEEMARHPSVRKTEIGRSIINSAIAKYESVFTFRPETIVSVVGLLSIDGRVDDAFQRIEKNNALIPSRIRVMAGLSILRSGVVNELHFTRVQEWLNQAMNEEPDSLVLTLHEAEYYTLKKDYPKAESSYESALKIDPKNVVALNNLAWLLAAKPESAQRSRDLILQASHTVGMTGDLLDTRARILIGERRFDAAEQDLLLALSMEKTPLRWFHLAVARMSQTPARRDEARDAFDNARKLGLNPTLIHPADMAIYELLDKAK